jgi:hypothetical protein
MPAVFAFFDGSDCGIRTPTIKDYRGCFPRDSRVEKLILFYRVIIVNQNEGIVPERFS